MTDDAASRLVRRLFDRPLIQNSFRGVFVEELLASYLAAHGWRHCGDDWGSWDFEHENGQRIELKQSSAIQSWSNTVPAAQRSPSFSIAEKAGYYQGQKWIEMRGRPAHIYVFAWHGERDVSKADHRVIEQWKFYPFRASTLPPSQKSIRLSELLRAGAIETVVDDLGNNISRLLAP